MGFMGMMGIMIFILPILPISPTSLIVPFHSRLLTAVGGLAWNIQVQSFQISTEDHAPW
jgi:hypothetical protein